MAWESILILLLPGRYHHEASNGSTAFSIEDSWKSSTISTLLHDKINPKDCQVKSTYFEKEHLRRTGAIFGFPALRLGNSEKKSVSDFSLNKRLEKNYCKKCQTPWLLPKKCGMLDKTFTHFFGMIHISQI